MDIITLLTFLVIAFCLGLAAVMIFKPKFLEISYVTWSRPKKIIFSIMCGLPLFALVPSSWLTLAFIFTFSVFFVLDRQQQFISFKVRI